MDEKIRECLPGREITGLEFDESRMLELLQYVRTLPAYKEVPVVCVHADHLNLSEAVMRNIDVAVKALGGVAFLSLQDGAIQYHKDCRFLGRVAAEGTNLSAN